MKTRKRALVSSAGAAVLGLLPMAHASAAPTRGNNPNAATSTVMCPSGVVTGSGAPGGALLVDGGGVAVLLGLANAQSGEVVIPVRPGLSGRGVLEQRTYVSPFKGTAFMAFVQIVP